MAKLIIGLNSYRQSENNRRLTYGTITIEAASTPPSGYPPISPIPPARLTISLLTGLYDQVVLAQFTGQQESFAMLRRLFDCSFEPYGRMIDRWIFEGSVEVDCADEFFIIRYAYIKRNTLRLAMANENLLCDSMCHSQGTSTSKKTLRSIGKRDFAFAPWRLVMG